MSRVSVIIPCYNAARHLPAALESVRAQTWPDVEVVAVDDGSSDGTWDILKKAESGRVRIFRQANAGASAARNRGRVEAAGDFIQYLDADDLLSPDKIEAQVRQLEPEGGRAVAYCNWSHFRNADLSDARFLEFPRYRDYDDPVEMLVSMWRDGWCVSVHAWLTPRAVADKAGPWNAGIGLFDDFDYFTRVLCSCDKVLYNRRARVYYRKGGAESLTSRPLTEKGVRSMLEGLKAREAAVRAREDSPRVRGALARDYYSFLYGFSGWWPDVDAAARARVAALGTPPPRAMGGRAMRSLMRVAGFWNVLRLRGALNRLARKGRRPCAG